jgi:hypothetical protein
MAIFEILVDIDVVAHLADDFKIHLPVIVFVNLGIINLLCKGSQVEKAGEEKYGDMFHCVCFQYKIRSTFVKRNKYSLYL